MSNKDITIYVAQNRQYPELMIQLLIVGKLGSFLDVKTFYYSSKTDDNLNDVIVDKHIDNTKPKIDSSIVFEYATAVSFKFNNDISIDNARKIVDGKAVFKGIAEYTDYTITIKPIIKTVSIQATQDRLSFQHIINEALPEYLTDAGVKDITVYSLHDSWAVSDINCDFSKNKSYNAKNLLDNHAAITPYGIDFNKHIRSLDKQDLAYRPLTERFLLQYKKVNAQGVCTDHKLVIVEASFQKYIFDKTRP